MELTVQGHKAYAYTGGKPLDPTRPCVVFIHGAAHDHSVWTLLARWWAQHGWAVLAVDQPGHRRSSGPLLPDVEAIAHWTLALMDATGVAQASLVGHSMGSLIALDAARQAPERVQHLVMMGTAYPMEVSPALQALARDDPAQAMDLINRLSISGAAIKPGVPGPGTWARGANRALMQLVQASQPEANVLAHDLALCQAYVRGLEAAAQVRCPVALIVAAADQMTPPQRSNALREALRARVTTLAGGHGLMQEQPDGVLAALREALGA